MPDVGARSDFSTHLCVCKGRPVGDASPKAQGLSKGNDTGEGPGGSPRGFRVRPSCMHVGALTDEIAIVPSICYR